MVVLDRKGLEQQACGCYRTARDALKPLALVAVPGDARQEEQPGGRLLRIARNAEPRRPTVREQRRWAGNRG